MLRLSVLLSLLLLCVSGTSAQDDEQPNTITPDNADNLTIAYLLEGHTMPIAALAYAPEGDILATAGDDLSLRLWSLVDGEQIDEQYPHNSAIRGVAFSPTEPLFVTTSWDRTVRLWTVTPDNTLEERTSLTGFSHIVERLDFSADGLWLAFAAGDGFVHMLNTSDFSDRVLYPVQALTITDVAFSADDTPVLAISTGFPDDQLLLTTPERTETVAVAHTHAGSITALDFSPSGDLVTAGDDGTLRLWSLDDDLNASAITTITAEDNPWFTDIAFNPAGDVLAAATLEGDILLWDMRDLEEAVLMAQLNTDDPQRINALAFSPAGDLLAAGGDDQRVQIWQVDA